VLNLCPSHSKKVNIEQYKLNEFLNVTLWSITMASLLIAINVWPTIVIGQPKVVIFFSRFL
jgi:hypothetical protein